MRLLATLSLVGAVAAWGTKCLPSGDEVAINDAFEKGGKGTTVTLCPGSVHRLSSPIRLRAPQQTLTTLSGATGRDRAMLIVEGETMATAIYADCKECSYATISNLIIDGNRPQMLRVPMGEALIEIGNGVGQRVTGCRLYEPRGWSALHVREGDSLNCRKAYVADNEIGPCGEEWDDEYDGLVEKNPPWGNPRADGISVACKDSMVERNVVFDTTDGAIVLFGSAGTEVRENAIYSRTRVVLGGINLVDYDPWKGDYTGVKVHHNRFFANGRYFKAGVVIGPSTWSDDTDTTVYGATVSDNAFYGEHYGYAIVVSSASGFTVVRNTIGDDAYFDGVPGPSCPTAPENGPPTAFLINRGSAKGTYQEDFHNGEVQHIICIQPPEVDGRGYKAWRMRDSPAAVAAKAEENPELGAGLESSLADALFVYQISLLEAIKEIEARMANGSAVDSGRSVPERSTELDSETLTDDNPEDTTRIGAVQSRIRTLEHGGTKLRSELQILSKEMSKLAGKVTAMADTQKPILQSVYNNVKKRGQEQQQQPPREREREYQPLPPLFSTPDFALGLSVDHAVMLLVVGSVLALAVLLLRKYRRSVPKGLKSK